MFAPIAKQANTTITTKQRWGHYFVLLFGALALVVSLNLRNLELNAVTTYINREVGIQAQYPRNWLLDEASVDYIFRVQDMQKIGFKTAYQVSIRPVSQETSGRTILDTLAMERAQTLAAYRVLNIEPITLGNELSGIAATYAYVEVGADPYLETIPEVVTGRDVIIIQRGQAIIVSLRSSANDFDRELPRFERFVNSLEL